MRTNEEINQTIYACITQLSKLQKEIDALKGVLGEVMQFYDDESDIHNQASHRQDGIPQPTKKSIFLRIIYEVIIDHGKFIHHNQICNVAVTKTPFRYRDHISRDVSLYVNYLKEKGKVLRYSAGGGNRNIFWGISDWMDGDKPKQEYMYDPNFLSSNHPEHPYNLTN